MKKTAILFSVLAILIACSTTNTDQNIDKISKKDSISTAQVAIDTIDKKLYQLIANETKKSPKINGDSADDCWKNQAWYPIKYLWLGNEFAANDFEGRFKLSWDKNKLYLLAEIKDDALIDIYQKWDTCWWNDDCVEIFIDENKGGDLHQFNYKAFAYHVALNTKDVVDLGPDQKPHLYNNHISTAKKTVGKTTIWEFAIDVYDDSYRDQKRNKAVQLSKGKEMGFCLNYCDNDTSQTRENFISSIPIAGEDKDLGWKDASVFNALILK